MLIFSSLYNFPFNRFDPISLAVIQLVLHNVTKSSVLNSAANRSSASTPNSNLTNPTKENEKKLTIRISKEQHWRNPSSRILQRKAICRHSVLLHIASTKMMNRSNGIHFGIVGSWFVCELGALEDVKVIVGSVPS